MRRIAEYWRRCMNWRSRRGLEFLIHFSGLGSTTPDLNGDAADGRDRTWVTYGARRTTERKPGHGSEGDPTLNNFDLLDDELEQPIRDLVANGARVVLITDTAHQSQVPRHKTALRVRGAPPDTRLHPLGGMSTPRVTTVKSGLLHLESGDGQAPAAEARVASGEIQGGFSSALAQALVAAEPTDTWQDVFNHATSVLVGNTGAAQQPRVAGDPGMAALPLPGRKTLPRPGGAAGLAATPRTLDLYISADDAASADVELIAQLHERLETADGLRQVEGPAQSDYTCN